MFFKMEDNTTNWDYYSDGEYYIKEDQEWRIVCDKTECLKRGSIFACYYVGYKNCSQYGDKKIL